VLESLISSLHRHCIWILALYSLYTSCYRISWTELWPHRKIPCCHHFQKSWVPSSQRFDCHTVLIYWDEVSFQLGMIIGYEDCILRRNCGPVNQKEVLPYKLSQLSSALCTFRPYNCPYAGSECSVTGDIQTLVAHLRDDHKVDMHTGCILYSMLMKAACA